LAFSSLIRLCLTCGCTLRQPRPARMERRAWTRHRLSVR
jgi:hypothetical protein